MEVIDVTSLRCLTPEACRRPVVPGRAAGTGGHGPIGPSPVPSGPQGPEVLRDGTSGTAVGVAARDTLSGMNQPDTFDGRLALALLHSTLGRPLDGSVCELRFVDRAGRTAAVAALYARAGDKVVVLIGEASAHPWWHGFTRPRAVTIRMEGRTRDGTGRMVAPGGKGRARALRIYRRQHPEAAVNATERFLTITLTAPPEEDE